MAEGIGFWKNKHVPVIGGGGFLGQQVLRKLMTVGYDKVLAPRKREYDVREREQIVRAQCGSRIVICRPLVRVRSSPSGRGGGGDPPPIVAILSSGLLSA